MSQLLIQRYLNDLASLKRVSGSTREGVVSEAFKDLLKGYARQHDLVFVAQHEISSPAKERRYVDGALLHALRVPFGYWEAKDEKDDLDAEIAFKFKRGYPQDNIIFEDSRIAVLIQHRQEVMRCAIDDVDQLGRLLKLFFEYERPEIAEFRKAVEQFKTDLPAVLAALRTMIDKAEKTNEKFRKAAAAFLKHAQDAINPSLTASDVREMLIQHVLTEELFAAVFPGTSFHSENNVARELYKLENTFFTGDTKFTTLKALAPYYSAIRSAAALVSGHHEKQSFLKVLYENFYKVYNAKAADRLGVVYTPNEIVRFMIDGADWLCEKYFGRNLIDKNVEILDPATGTGTFVCELLEHFRGQPAKLRHKYENEVFANEVAILPYYVANLNIEATYSAIAGEYREFPNLCFVDTLDNVAFKERARGQFEMFGAVTDENVSRIRRQNSRKISVIIGNPPYNANQMNENENNKNREYPEIDQRIRETYVAYSTAQKTKRYDMYSRFFRWASDRLDRNGVLAFITNRNFIEAREADGFRQQIAAEFSAVYVLDLGGDVRANAKLSGTTHNVFGIQTGVAISFLVRRENQSGCRIYYARRPEFETASEKLAFLDASRLRDVETEEVALDSQNNWLHHSVSDFDSFIPLATRDAKRTADRRRAEVVFGTFSSGIKTNRDDWVYDFSSESLTRKSAFFHRQLSRVIKAGIVPDTDSTVKWSRDLKLKVSRGVAGVPSSGKQVESLWRPFVKKSYWVNKTLSDILTENHFRTYGPDLSTPNPTIAFLCVYSSNPLAVMATRGPFDYCLLKMGNGGTESVARWVDPAAGQKVDNITDWALDRFSGRYAKMQSGAGRRISKDSIFQYVYGVLHDPLYRTKYAQELRREFPRIPFHADFWQWADWGKTLMDLHVGYETATPFVLRRVDVVDQNETEAGLKPKTLLKSDRDKGQIRIDSETTLSGVPPTAWHYQLGNRSALEWVLEQYKEKTPKDPTIREKFNSYRFSDHKESVIDLLARVTTVSVETMKIVEAMRTMKR